MFWEVDLFPSSNEGLEPPTLLGPKQIQLQQCFLFVSLEYQKIDQIQKSSNPECYIPSEPFTI
jgi:hypothetical protein